MSACLPALLAGLCIGYLLCFCSVIASGIVGEWRRRRQWKPPVNAEGEWLCRTCGKSSSVCTCPIQTRPADLHEQARDRIRRGR